MMELSEATRARFAREVAKYPPDQKQSAVMACLAIVQNEEGHVSPEAEEAVAAYLGMPPIAVYEVASFYAMYNLNPVGRHKLTVCTNLPCALSGGTTAAAYLKSRLGIDFNETTADGRFTLKEGECMGACGDAPVLLVDNKRMVSWMSDDKLDRLLDDLK